MLTAKNREKQGNEFFQYGQCCHWRLVEINFYNLPFLMNKNQRELWMHRVDPDVMKN